MQHPSTHVTLEWSILFDLNWEAVTKTFSSLKTELLPKVLCESTWTMSIRMIRGVRGHGGYPRHTRWFRGSVGSAQWRLDWHKNSDLGSECYISIGLHFLRRYIGLPLFLTPKPMYNTNLVWVLCTIWSRSYLVYDTISWQTLVRYQSQSHHYYGTWYWGSYDPYWLSQ